MDKNKKTVVLGASPNPSRYAYAATQSLSRKGHEVVAVGLRKGEIGRVPIHDDKPQVADVDTVTLYVGPQNQEFWKDYVFSLNPKRVIFNPGTENPDFERELRAKGIETEAACTLVLLSMGNY